MPGERNFSHLHTVSLSPGMFQVEAKRNWKTLQEKTPDLLAAQTMFVGERTVWPDQCKRLENLLQEIEAPVETFYALLDDPEGSPAAVISSRYPLIMVLQHTCKYIKALTQLLQEFRSMYRQPLWQLRSYRQEILRQIELLVQSYHEVLTYGQVLLDQLHFL